MGIETRREREKQELRKAILDAALTTAQVEGWQKVTVRKIADQIEYSPPTIYEYFNNKDAVLAELKIEGYSRKLVYLQQALSAAKASHASPEQTILALAHAYYSFAQENPQLYALMHGIGIHCDLTFPTKAEQEIFKLAATAVKSLLPLLSEEQILSAVQILVTVLNGFVVRTLTHNSDFSEAANPQLLTITLASLLEAWVNNPSLLDTSS